MRCGISCFGIKWSSQNHQNSDRISLLLLAQIVFGSTTAENKVLISYTWTLLRARHGGRLPTSPCLGAGDRINISQQVTTSHDGSRQGRGRGGKCQA